MNPEVVAPHAGAWIETGRLCRVGRGGTVAPHAGAWIETSAMTCACACTVSPLTQGRGLKRDTFLRLPST
tara:strand:- start:794 stop:1003 length:210 start_codon:yes stop_codon:yes gene_type:complete